MIDFVENGNRYQIKCEKTKRFHDTEGVLTFFYGYKNGTYLSGTSSYVSEKESLSLLLKLENIVLKNAVFGD